MTARLLSTFGFVAVLGGEDQQVLPVGADRIAIRPTGAARLERAVVPAQDLERGRLTDAAPTNGVHDLSAAKEQVPDVAAGAHADHALAPRETLHLHQVRETCAVEIGAKAAFTHRVGGLFATVHCGHVTPEQIEAG